jgi:hypothetical protein
MIEGGLVEVRDSVLLPRTDSGLLPRADSDRLPRADSDRLPRPEPGLGDSSGSGVLNMTDLGLEVFGVSERLYIMELGRDEPWESLNCNEVGGRDEPGDSAFWSIVDEI